MPLIRISLRAGKSASHRRAVAENVYQALRETYDVPEHDFFATIAEHQPEDFFFDRGYLENWSFGLAQYV